MTIAEQLALEEVIHNKDMAVRDAKRLVTEAFQREMGVAASEQRTERYMLKSTVGNLTMLDPTGGRLLAGSERDVDWIRCRPESVSDPPVCTAGPRTMMFWMVMDIFVYFPHRVKGL